MNEIIVIDARIAFKWLSLKMQFFIFPTPPSKSDEKHFYNALFENWKQLVSGGEVQFPPQSLMDVYDLECSYQRSYFFRTFNKFQNMLNALFIEHGVFDSLATPAYQTMTVHKGFLRFEPTEHLATQARWCDNSKRFSKVPHNDDRDDSRRTVYVAPASPLVEIH